MAINFEDESMNMTTLTEERLDTVQAAKYLGMSRGTLAVWRAEKRYKLPYIKIGGRVFYRKSALDEWINSREFTG